MHTTGEGAIDEPTRWDELLDAAIVRLEEIADRFVDRARRLPAYAQSPVPASDIRGTAHESVRGLLRAIADAPRGGDPRAELDLIGTSLGARRARAGIPLDALMSAVRLDFSVIWEELTELASVADAPLLVRRAGRLWDAVDEYADGVRASYAEEIARMAAEASSLRQDLIASVFGPAVETREGRERIREGLGLREDDRFLVAVADAADLPQLREVVALARRRGSEGFVHALGSDSVVFWRAPRSPALAAELEEIVTGTRCGLVSEVVGVEGIAVAARTAALLARSLEPGERGALTIARGWHRIARSGLAAEGVDLRERVDRALESIRPADREVLVATIRAYLATGSVAAVAEREFCHRNTVLNRIRRLAELTGLDVTVPEDAALLVVAWA